jgi:hypothetical protein
VRGLTVLPILFILLLGTPQRVQAEGPSDLWQVAVGFLTNLAIHESGHFFMAEGANAPDNRLDFFSKKEGSFFLGLSTVKAIDDKYRLPYILGGEIATGLSFEMALRWYRITPTTYNRSLLFFSGTDFLWYSVYAFYLAPARDERYDPVAISKETGIAPEAILMVAVTQTMLNAYRVVSGQDRLIPYFTFDRESISFRIGYHF